VSAQRWRPVLWLGLRMSAPALPALAAGVLLVALIIPETRLRAVTLVLPLAAGVQAALLFAPDDEPALELTLAAPRSPWWMVIERLLPLLALQGAAGLAGSAIVVAAWQAPVLLLVVDWVFPTCAMIGVGLLLTFVTRRSGAGVLLVLLLCGGFLLGGDALVARFPHLLFVHLYLTPFSAGWLSAPLGLDGDIAYLLNRLILLLIGVLCLARVLRGLRDAESVLGADRRRAE
jgi:hypothetical protein